MTRRKTVTRSLVPDVARCAHRCCFRGCANRPRPGAICCDVHGRAMAGTIAVQERQRGGEVKYCIRCGDLTSTRLCAPCMAADEAAAGLEAGDTLPPVKAESTATVTPAATSNPGVS